MQTPPAYTTPPKSSHLVYEKMRRGVLITLNRLERLNALSEELRAELHQAFDESIEDPAVRAIVLTGAGWAFSAGAMINFSTSASGLWSELRWSAPRRSSSTSP
jgi:enoyl-CoA hydratase/carnithine racemase